MKNAIIGMTFMWVFLLGALSLLSMSEQSIRRIYLEQTLTAVMEDAMLKEQMLRSQETEDREQMEEELRKVNFMNRFFICLEEKMGGKQQLNINLIGLDLDKGIMSVVVESIFQYPTGERGKIEVYRTIILEMHGKGAVSTAPLLEINAIKIIWYFHI